MVKAGFDSVFIGIESPNDGNLTECQKVQNKNRDLINDLKKLCSALVCRFRGDLLLALTVIPRQLSSNLSILYIKNGIVSAMVGRLQAPPGTRLFDRLKKDNRLLDIMISGDNVDGTTNIDPKMGLDKLMNGYRFIMGYIYSPKHYYRRVKIFLKEFGSSMVQTPVDLQRFFAFPFQHSTMNFRQGAF
jgi:hypothetical protein